MKQRRDLDLTPTTALIIAQRERRFTWIEFFGELIDNSFDAGASRVDIESKSDRMTISDDGCGCADISSMLRLGDHQRHDTTQSGRYGVGLKDAAIWAAEITKIETQTKTRLSEVSVAWSEIAESNQWSIEHEVTDVIGPPGTRIGLRKLLRRPRMARHQREISFLFAPALLSKKTIAVNGKALKPWRLPELVQSARRELWIGDRRARIFAGTIAPGHKVEHSGFLITNAFRVIEETHGPEDDLRSARFFAWVELEGHWPLSRNKDQVGDEVRDELWGALREVCDAELRAAYEASDNIELDAELDEINTLLSNAFGKKPRTTKKSETSGNGGSRSRRKSSGQRMQADPRGLKCAYADLGDGVVSKVDIDACFITLNDSHPTASALRGDPLGKARLAVEQYATAIALNGTDRQMELRFGDEYGGDPFSAYQQKLADWLSHVESAADSKRKAS
jgi:hypothetical protein